MGFSESLGEIFLGRFNQMSIGNIGVFGDFSSCYIYNIKDIDIEQSNFIVV